MSKPTQVKVQEILMGVWPSACASNAKIKAKEEEKEGESLSVMTSDAPSSLPPILPITKGNNILVRIHATSLFPVHFFLYSSSSSLLLPLLLVRIHTSSCSVMHRAFLSFLCSLLPLPFLPLPFFILSP